MGHASAVEQSFAEDVEVRSDGGGTVAAGAVARGRDWAARLSGPQPAGDNREDS